MNIFRLTNSPPALSVDYLHGLTGIVDEQFSTLAMLLAHEHYRRYWKPYG